VVGEAKKPKERYKAERKRGGIGRYTEEMTRSERVAED